MRNNKILIVCNLLVLVSCLLQIVNEVQEGFEGVKVHHGLIIYMVAELIIRLREAKEVAVKLKGVESE